MADVRWERSALGVVLDVGTRSRQRIVRQVGLLARFPTLGLPALGPFLGKRRLIVGPYSIVYEYDETADVVSVIAIARGGPLFR